ncbi:MAG TPA: helix-turn-helix transcriptional regulator [Candidatus Dietzia merdigallinarum]|nr:helix-turn-helix transcriptional regulator [Candidatus Dietzia merdigallinarum]
MSPRLDVEDLGPDDSVLVISMAAELSGLHAQTLRTYDRLGIVTPERTRGGGRRYSLRDVAMLREVQRLSQEEGVNLAGIKRIIELTNQVDALRNRVADLIDEVADLRRRQGLGGRSGELVHVPRSTSVVVWRPRHERGNREDGV